MRSDHAMDDLLVKLGQLKLFPPDVCSVHCFACQSVTVHFWGKLTSDTPLRLICNECGWNAVVNPSLKES